jgi:hypothetical protein
MSTCTTGKGKDARNRTPRERAGERRPPLESHFGKEKVKEWSNLDRFSQVKKR